MAGEFKRWDGSLVRAPLAGSPWIFRRFQRFRKPGPLNLNNFLWKDRKAFFEAFKDMPRETADAVGVFRFAEWSSKELGVRMPPTNIAAADWERAKELYAACCAWAWKLPDNGATLTRRIFGETDDGPELLGIRCPAVYTDWAPFDPHAARKAHIPRFASYPSSATSDPFDMDGARDQVIIEWTKKRRIFWREGEIVSGRDAGTNANKEIEKDFAKVKTSVEATMGTETEIYFPPSLEDIPNIMKDVERLGGWRFWKNRSGNLLELDCDAPKQSFKKMFNEAIYKHINAMQFKSVLWIIWLILKWDEFDRDDNRLWQIMIMVCWLACAPDNAKVYGSSTDAPKLVRWIGDCLPSIKQKYIDSDAFRKLDEGEFLKNYKEHRRKSLLDDLRFYADISGDYWASLVPDGARNDFIASMELWAKENPQRAKPPTSQGTAQSISKATTLKVKPEKNEGIDKGKPCPAKPDAPSAATEKRIPPSAEKETAITKTNRHPFSPPIVETVSDERRHSFRMFRATSLPDARLGVSIDEPTGRRVYLFPKGSNICHLWVQDRAGQEDFIKKALDEGWLLHGGVSGKWRTAVDMLFFSFRSAAAFATGNEPNDRFCMEQWTNEEGQSLDQKAADTRELTKETDGKQYARTPSEVPLRTFRITKLKNLWDNNGKRLGVEARMRVVGGRVILLEGSGTDYDCVTNSPEANSVRRKAIEDGYLVEGERFWETTSDLEFGSFGSAAAFVRGGREQRCGDASTLSRTWWTDENGVSLDEYFIGRDPNTWLEEAKQSAYNS